MNVEQMLETAQADCFWMPPEVTVVDRPEIRYTFCPRRVETFNSVFRLRASAERIPALVDEVAKAHAHTLSRWMLASPSRCDELDRRLEGAGYVPMVEHYGVAMGVGEHEPRSTPGIVVERIETVEGMRRRQSVMERAFGKRVPLTDDDLCRLVTHSTGPGARTAMFLALDEESGEPISSGGMTLHPTVGLTFLWAGGTVPEHRGRGAYSALVTARVAHAKQCGQRYVGLYARIDTSAPIVQRQGFHRYGRMTFWDRAMGRDRESG